MSTPTKFGMGCVPRTSTGLIPSSYRKRMDQMCSPKDWSVLPPQPKPEMYPYRGDYVNERNRKQGARKIIKRPTRRKAQRSVIVTSENANNPKWDTYCQHISYTKLSAEEQAAKTKNKEKILAYMRSEASKRERKVALEKKLEAELESDKPKRLEPTPKPRKPPVPRLSHLARTGKRTNSEIKRSEQVHNENNTKTKETETVKVEKQLKARYLDFISTRIDKPLLSQRMVENRNPDGRRSSSVYNYDEIAPESDFDYSDSRFRTNIETIVKKTASMVIEQIKDDDTNDTLDSSVVVDTVLRAYSRLASACEHSKQLDSETESLTGFEAQSKCDMRQNTQKSYVSDISSRLHEIEDRIRCISGSSLLREVNRALQPKSECSYVGIDVLPYSQAFSSCSSHISEVTFQTPNERGLNTKDKVQQNKIHIEDLDRSSCANDSVTEAMPRAQIQPTQMDLNGYDNMYSYCKQTINESSGCTDAFSWSVSLTNECESVPEKKAPQKHMSPQMILDELRPLTSYSQQIALPLQPVEWDEEPLPRGYELQSQRDNDFADEIFSLLE